MIGRNVPVQLCMCKVKTKKVQEREIYIYIYIVNIYIYIYQGCSWVNTKVLSQEMGLEHTFSSGTYALFGTLDFRTGLSSPVRCIGYPGYQSIGDQCCMPKAWYWSVGNLSGGGVLEKNPFGLLDSYIDNIANSWFANRQGLFFRIPGGASISIPTDKLTTWQPTLPTFAAAKSGLITIVPKWII